MEMSNDELVNRQQALNKTQRQFNEAVGVPEGYITIELSTKGKCYAPPIFHMKNFSTESIVDLTLTQEDEVAIRVAEMLDDLILEPGISVKDFNEKEVIETLVRLYRVFYTPKMENITYELTDKDWEFIAEQEGGMDSDGYRNRKRDYDTKRWKPTFSIDLNKVHIFDIDDDFKKSARIKKPNGFTCKYELPKYGDSIFAAEYVKNRWRLKDKQYENIGRMLKFKQDSEQRWRNGENINLSSIPQVSAEDEKKYYEYAREKSKDVMKTLKVLHLTEFNGMDLTGMTLEEKFQFADDPQLDFPTFNKIMTKFDELPVGVDPNVDIVNPVTGVSEKYNFPFRVDTFLQAIGDNESSDDVIEFE